MLAVVEEKLRLKELLGAGVFVSIAAIGLSRMKVAIANELSRLGSRDDGPRRDLVSSSSSARGR